MPDLDLTYDPRAAGEIARYHSWAVHRVQSVAEHTWQVMRILLTVWPKAPRNLLIFVVLHDMNEMAGDVQYPFKLLVPELKPAMAKAESIVEQRQRDAIGRPVVTHAPSAFEHHVFKVCEWVEMWEYGLREMNMGNRYGRVIRDRMSRAVTDGLFAIEQNFNGSQQFEQNTELTTAIRRYMTNRLTMETDDAN